MCVLVRRERESVCVSKERESVCVCVSKEREENGRTAESNM